MQLPGRDDIEAAAERIRPHVRVTPTITVDGDQIDLRPDVRVTLKLESLQHAGSFKPRGAFNFLLSHEIPEAGIVAASGGNHGLAVAHAARRLGTRAEIFVPQSSPGIKVARLRSLGATVHQHGALYDDARIAAGEHADKARALDVPAYDHFAIIAGAGSLARELERQQDGFDTILVAVGGGGLIGGTAAWIRDSRRVAAVETRGCAALHEARKAGRPVPVEVRGIAADSLGARIVGDLPFACAREWVDESLTVPDGDVRRAQRLLWDRLRVVAEPGGAAALAALLSGEYRARGGEHVAVIVCGANVDPATVTA